MILPVKEAEMGQESKKSNRNVAFLCSFLFSRKLFLSGAADSESY